VKTLQRAYLLLALGFLYLPIAVLIVFSFNSARSRAVWGGFSLKWYVSLFQDQQILGALYVTLTIAVLASAVSTVIGTAAAIGINAFGGFSRKAALTLNNLPVLNPDIVTGVSLMILFVFTRGVFKFAELGYGTLLTAHISFCVPYVVLTVLPKVRQLDKNLYEAALDLGAKPSAAMRKVVLPELWPGIVSGAIFAFTLSLDDFVISVFTAGAGVTNLSVIIYSSAARRGVTPQINALSALMFVVMMGLMFAVNFRDRQAAKAENGRRAQS
jgi:spermidine/putrescine transport system permease protein